MYKLISLFLIFIAANLQAQPVERLPASPADYHPNVYRYFLHNSSDVSGFKNLKKLRTIFLYLSLNSLPKEIDHLSDSLKEIYLNGFDKLTDISALKSLKNLESITIENYAGTDLPDLSGLKNLTTVVIKKEFSGDKLKSVSGLSGCFSLKNLLIRSSSLEKLDFNMSGMRLEDIHLNCTALTDITGITAITSLKKLGLYALPLEHLPPDMKNLGNLESLELSYMPLREIKTLTNMHSLKALWLSDCALTNIPDSFKTNVRIETLSIEFCRKLTSANGITDFKALKKLYIENVDTNFVLPPKLFTCENLEEIHLANGWGDISMIRGLMHLKMLLFVGFQFEKLPATFFTNQNLEELKIAGNNKVKDLTAINKFKKLKILRLFSNKNLNTIPNLPKDMPWLADVYVFGNNSLFIPEEYKKFKPKWTFKE